MLGGKVTLRIDKEKNDLVVLSVKDTGCGLSQEELPLIFDRFTRLEKTEDSVSGTGIGLALVKQLVDTHGGSIVVNSELGVGSEFIVRFPLVECQSESSKSLTEKSKNYVSESIENIHSEQPIEAHLDAVTDGKRDLNKPSILIIEDNIDMRYFIKGVIMNDYQVITANDGEEGINIAIEQVPDLIISDLMMPKMDGYQVAKTLKSNQATSHIPLILLTAKGDKQSRIRGWQENVDEYLTKPFNVDELLVRIANLLSIRELLRQRFKQQIQHNESNLLRHVVNLEEVDNGSDSVEQQFIERLNQILSKHIEDHKLKVETIAQALYMTERQLFRKLKALVDVSPGNYLRNFRLEKASLLLMQGRSSGEVAESVGFSSPSYFNRCFKAKFGSSPTDFIAMNNR
jgi:DNA-binding response OmpR family regulator